LGRSQWLRLALYSIMTPGHGDARQWTRIVFLTNEVVSGAGAR
jgi:hypothetical protein